MQNDTLTAVGKATLYVGMFFLVVILFAFPVKWLINYVLSPAALSLVFGGTLTIWKALGLSTLTGILFGNKGTSK